VLHFKISRIFLGPEGTDAIRNIDGNQKQREKFFSEKKEKRETTTSPDLSIASMTLKT
jgi:hypothetical protein